MFHSIFIINIGGKLQITLLKFGDNWILHREVSEFRFYHMKFEGVWILHTNVSEFGFYLLYYFTL